MLEIPGPLIFTLIGMLCFLIASYKIMDMNDSIDLKIGKAISNKYIEIDKMIIDTERLNVLEETIIELEDEIIELKKVIKHG